MYKWEAAFTDNCIRTEPTVGAIGSTDVKKSVGRQYCVQCECAFNYTRM